MRATFALLTDRTVENAVNRLAWQIHLGWVTGVGVRRLAPHVSLKQPFDIGEDLAALERYMTRFAADVPPLHVRLRGLCVWRTVLSIGVDETPALRALHERLNRELPRLFGDVSAEHDGDGYRFHLTVAMGGASAETYQAIYRENAAQPVPAGFTARELALFVYHEAPPGRREYMTHTVLPLTGGAGI